MWKKHGKINGFVISDLHIFNENSSSEVLISELSGLAQPQDLIILNGDIFDFRWTKKNSIAETEICAMEWLAAFCKKFRSCQIFYILGNNDCHEGFTNMLRNSESSIPNLQWFTSTIRLGSSLFFHGDMPVLNPFWNFFNRRIPPQVKRTGKFKRVLFSCLLKKLIHFLAGKIFSPNRCAKKIRYAIRMHKRTLLLEIKDVYFGHIHVPFNNFSYKGIYFHNTGATVAGASYQIIQFQENI